MPEKAAVRPFRLCYCYTSEDLLDLSMPIGLKRKSLQPKVIRFRHVGVHEGEEIDLARAPGVERRRPARLRGSRRLREPQVPDREPRKSTVFSNLLPLSSSTECRDTHVEALRGSPRSRSCVLWGATSRALWASMRSWGTTSPPR